MKQASKFIASLLSLLSLLSFHTNAQVLTVEEAVAAALKNNYDLLLIRSDSAVLAVNDKYSFGELLPSVNASAGLIFNNNSQNQRLADGTVRKRSGIRSDNIQTAVNLNWVIFDGFRVFATRDRLAELVRLGALNVQVQAVNTVSDVIKTYYNVVRRKQQLKAIDEQMRLNEERAEIAEKKLSVGLGAKPELLQAQLDLNAQKAARLAELTLQEQLKEQLNLLISFKPGTVYEVTDSIPIDKSITLGEAYATAASSSPELKAAQLEINVARITLRERRAERFPIVSFNSAYNFNRTTNDAVVNSFTPLFNRNAGFNYGIGITVPIFNGFATRRNIEVAKLDIRNREINYDFAQLRANAAVTAAFKDYQLQQRILDLEEVNIGLAKENVYIASERLRLGITTSLELREAQKSLEDAYNRVIAARYNAKVAETELKRLQGTLIERM